MISYQGIDDKSVVYPSVKPNGGGIVTCITYGPPIVDLPVGSKNKVCNNPTMFNFLEIIKGSSSGLLTFIRKITMLSSSTFMEQTHSFLKLGGGLAKLSTLQHILMQCI